MTHENDQDRAIILLTVCVVLLTVHQILMGYQIEQLEPIQDRRNDEQNEPIPKLR